MRRRLFFIVMSVMLVAFAFAPMTVNAASPVAVMPESPASDTTPDTPAPAADIDDEAADVATFSDDFPVTMMMVAPNLDYDTPFIAPNIDEEDADSLVFIAPNTGEAPYMVYLYGSSIVLAGAAFITARKLKK